jgi:colanic acid/amylovoran biosynthesis glycosyltransferase
MNTAIKPVTRRMAYLSAQHPKLSMTFITREIDELQRLGFAIEIASVNDAEMPPEKMTTVENAQAAVTHYIKRLGVLGALKAHGYALLKHPAGYLRGWRRALAFGGLDVVAQLKHAAYLTEALMVGQWMAQRQLKHVHVHLGSQPATVGLFTKVVFDVGLSITVHGADEFYDAVTQHLAEKVAGADFIVCISNFARSQLMFCSDHEHWHKLVVCRLGIDLTRFAARPYKRVRTDENFHILCVGRLAAAKGQHLLVQAVAQLKAMGRPVTLDVVGAGPNAASLAALVQRLNASDYITLSGPITQDHIHEHYGRADCFSMPSFAEGIPVVLMESMSMQIPCVTTYITGIPELIISGETSLLVPPSDVDSLVGALDKLIQDPALAKRLGEAARIKVQADYDLPRNVGKLATIFAERVQDSPRLGAPG